MAQPRPKAIGFLPGAIVSATPLPIRSLRLVVSKDYDMRECILSFVAKEVFIMHVIS
jgi:hypothetical protein